MFHIPGVSKISSNIKSGALLEIKGFLPVNGIYFPFMPLLVFYPLFPFIYEEI